MKTLITAIIAILLLTVGAVWLFSDKPMQNANRSPLPPDAGEMEIQTVATDLDTPWEIGFLPTGEMLVTERSGTLRFFSGTTTLAFPIEEVVEVGEGGLLGLAIHPSFSTNNFIYLYYTTRVQNRTINRVARYVFRDNSLSQPAIIIDNIPGASNHNGGRIAFGPDGYLYVTTGDAGNPNSSQDRNSLAGKILRITADGQIPTDNPFQNAVYAYGIRNSQGLAWDSEGRLWATDHGRSGIRSGMDEINLIEAGGNYGWPVIEGDEQREGMISPVIHSGPDVTWAPAGIVVSNNRIFFAGLRGRTLYEISIHEQEELGMITEHFKDEFGRLRAVSLDENGLLYISTSNRDGRGNPSATDDRILRLTP
jgi:glucose/arabinose dehydrogenase